LPYLASMKACLLPAVLMASILVCGCKEEENTPGLCITTPTPRVDLVSWPSGLNVDSTWTVPRSSILLYASVLGRVCDHRAHCGWREAKRADDEGVAG